MKTHKLLNFRFLTCTITLAWLVACSGDTSNNSDSNSAAGKIKVGNTDFYRAITGLYLVKSGNPDWGGNWMSSSSISVGYEWQAPLNVGSWDVKIQWSDGEVAIARNQVVTENQTTAVNITPGSYQGTLRIINNYTVHVVQLYVIHSTSYNGTFPSINWIKGSSIPYASYYDLKVPSNGTYKVRAIWSNGNESTATSSIVPGSGYSTLGINP